MSKVISIERKDAELKLNAVYPNPNDGNFVVNLTSMPNEDGKIILVNALGVKVFTKELNAQGGRTIEKINVSHLPTGIYTLLLEQNDEIITKRVMIDR
ncbi:MAG TPA: T9SS type A sorting domain-containing protein [Bacteroidetes bacterium]|nr:T9SS type A sorting domain-containing protein [Bacteroidota bacterium]